MRQNILTMLSILKVLRIVQWSMLGSIPLCGVLGELAGPPPGRIDQTLSYILSSLAVGVVGTIFVLRRTLVIPAAAGLTTNPGDGLSLNHWKTGYLATYALCDALAMFGLVLRFRGSGLQQSLLFYIGGFVLLAFFRPSLPGSRART
jgi:hypothetical protein